MADPLDEFNEVHRAVKVIEYPLPPSVKNDRFRDLHEMAKSVKEFREEVFNRKNPKLCNNTFVWRT